MFGPVGNIPKLLQEILQDDCVVVDSYDKIDPKTTELILNEVRITSFDQFSEISGDYPISLIQQSTLTHDPDVLNKKITTIYHSTPILKSFIREYYSGKLVELGFPIRSEFEITTPWSDRLDKFVFHGRIYEQKISIKFLKELQKHNIEIDLYGPVCKKYWSDEDESEEKYHIYKQEITKLDNVTLYPQIVNSEVPQMLNKYKFFTIFSSGEAFNLSLQEAMACGTVPLVRWNDAFGWSENTLLKFYNEEVICDTYMGLKGKDLTGYSGAISTFIHNKYSFQIIKELLKQSQKYTN